MLLKKIMKIKRCVFHSIIILVIISSVSAQHLTKAASNLSASMIQKTSEEIETWHINLKLESLDGKARDTYNRAGVVITPGIDPQQLSALDLTPPGSYIRLVLNNPSKPDREPYSYDYREPDLDEYYWEVELSTNYSAIDVNVTLDNVSEVPDNYTVTLTDNDTGDLYEIHDNKTFEVSLTSGASKTFLLAATKNEIQEIQPPSDIQVYDVEDDNGHTVQIIWKLSPDDAILTHYNIYRSRHSTLTEPVEISSFDSIQELIAAEESTTILINQVTRGEMTCIDSTIPVSNVTYYYWLQAVSEAGSSEKVAAYIETSITETPSSYHIFPPYPNPFNPTTTISYTIPKDCHVSLVIYDILGREIMPLQDGLLNAGMHSSSWSGKNSHGEFVASGVYLYSFKAGHYTHKGKVMFMR